jgi:hypothetical protein
VPSIGNSGVRWQVPNRLFENYLTLALCSHFVLMLVATLGEAFRLGWRVKAIEGTRWVLRRPEATHICGASSSCVGLRVGEATVSGGWLTHARGRSAPAG